MFINALRLLMISTLFLGLAYPLTLTWLGNILFPFQVQGSVLEAQGKIQGSSLLAQKFKNPKYFWPRPSAADFNTLVSGASNLGATSQKLADTIQERRKKLQATLELSGSQKIPPELLLASASGLDPHLSTEAAEFQVERILQARNLPSDKKSEILKMIATHREGLSWGLLGQNRVNVLNLNLSLDQNFHEKLAMKHDSHKVNTEQRPNPDQLLSVVQDQEKKRKEGSLKIFLGMIAGVGKTYAMLAEAKARTVETNGSSVVVGFVETHGRQETAALLAGFEVIPRRKIEYRGTVQEEMDLDAILERKPRLVLVDELAHTNIPGSRHNKRYMDVLEILRNGIDVYTTLNIQHILSRSDTVREITGVSVQETIPDSIIDRANEVELVDISPDEVLERLKEGKIYPPERIEIASQHFFREGHLNALRELALRFAADRVDQELRNLKVLEGIPKVWKTGNRLMVSVYGSPYSERMIRWTRRLAYSLGAQWVGAYIDDSRPLSNQKRLLLEKNLNLVQSLGGKIVSTQDNDIVRGLLHLARENQVSHLVIGKSRASSFWNFFKGGTITQRLLKESEELDIYIVSAPDLGAPNKSQAPRSPFKLRWTRFLWTFLSVAILTGLFLLLEPWMGYRAVGVTHLLAINLLALRLQFSNTLLAAVLASICWNFFFIPPRFTFTIHAAEDWLMFGMILIAGLTMGGLTSRLRHNQEIMRKREARILALYNFTEAISSSHQIEKIIQLGIHQISSSFETKTEVFLKPMSEAKGDLLHYPAEAPPLSEKEKTVPEWVIANAMPAGHFTETLPFAEAYYLPLFGSQGVIGALRLHFRKGSELAYAHKILLENFARQLALNIEREWLNESLRKTQVAEESEKIYRTLMDSVSHELKTPLAAIEGSASALLNNQVIQNPESIQDLAKEIISGSQRMKGLVENLINMSHIEAKKIHLSRELCDFNDLISILLDRIDPFLKGRHLIIETPPDIPLIEMDFSLMEQALRNILHNACIYTPPGTRIYFKVILEQNKLLRIFIEDDGPGLPPENLERVFEKFFRGRPKVTGGSGLGLTISKALINLHGGTIISENRRGGGARFIITVPLGEV